MADGRGNLKELSPAEERRYHCCSEICSRNSERGEGLPITMIKLLTDENVLVEAVKILKSWSIDIVSIVDFSPGLNDRDVINLSI